MTPFLFRRRKAVRHEIAVLSEDDEQRAVCSRPDRRVLERNHPPRSAANHFALRVCRCCRTPACSEFGRSNQFGHFTLGDDSH